MSAPDCEFCVARSAAAKRTLDLDDGSPFLSIDDRLFGVVVAAMPEIVNWEALGIRANHGPHPSYLALDGMANGSH